MLDFMVNIPKINQIDGYTVIHDIVWNGDLATNSKFVAEWSRLGYSRVMVAQSPFHKPRSFPA